MIDLRDLTLLSLIFLLACMPIKVGANVQQQSSTASVNEKSEASSLLEKAQSLVGTDNQQSIELASHALQLSSEQQDDALKAKIHSFLANLYERQQQNFEQAKYHLQHSLSLYESLNKPKNLISATTQYADILMSEKDYEAAYFSLNTAFPIALDYGDNLLIARILNMLARVGYDKQQYKESEKDYLAAIQYLDSEDSAKANKLRGQVYHQLGQIHKRYRNHDQSAFFHKKSLEVYTSLKNERQIAKSLKNVAHAEYRKQDYLVALDYAVRGLEIQKQLNEPSEYAEYLTLLGIIYRYLNRYERSLEYSVQAHQLYKDINNVDKIANSLIQIGFLYMRLQKFEQAKTFYQEAINLPEGQVPAGTIAAAYREMASIELQDKKYSAAMKMAEKAYDIYQQNRDLSKSTIAVRIMGEINYAEENFQQAILNFREALSLAEETGHALNKVKILNMLGMALTKAKDNDALPTLQRALGIAIKQNFLKEQASAYDSLMAIAKSENDYEAAFNFAEHKIRLSKLIYQNNEKNELAFAKARLDSHIMETEITSLKKQAKLDQLMLEQKNNEIEIAGQANQIGELELVKNRYASFFLASLLFICVCVCFYIFRIFVASRQHNEELDYLATHDQLTNSLNRRGLFKAMEGQNQNSELSDRCGIIMLDIDHFKKVNDVFGHDAGDRVLRSIAATLQAAVRKCDLVARYGGEEFCIVLRGIEEGHAERLAESLRKKIEETEFNDIKVTSSFGLAVACLRDVAPTGLITRSDEALYISKADGRNRVTVWSEQLNKNT